MRKAAATLMLLVLAACGGESPTAAPKGAALLFEATARATNIYVCDNAQWTLKQKGEEVLFDNGGGRIGTSSTTPYSTTWRGDDGSSIIGRAEARADGMGQGDTPVLKYAITSRQGAGRFTPVMTVRRVSSRCAAPSSRECSTPGSERQLNYAAGYQFYGAGEHR